MPLIRIRGLTKLYRMGDSIVHALDGVDLDIEEGEFVAITGPSGSGKSTIMHLIGCLDRPTAGTVLLNGRDVGEMPDRELASVRNQYIGFVFQTFNLINRTSALENVGIPLFYARSTSRGPARRALERVGLMPRASHTPAELSGGERQRVAIARAIVNDPLLLLADEPTGNLDSRTGKQIMEIFRSLNEQGVTIVLVTHEHGVATQAKRIVQMCDGKVVSDEPTEQARVDGDQAAAKSAPLSAVARPTVADNARPLPACEPEARASASAVSPAVEIPPRFAGGANGAFGCGLAAPIFLLTAVIAGVVLARMGIDPKQFSAQNPPPPSFTVLVLLTALGVLLANVTGIVGIIWGRSVLRRIRTVPGVWIGARRARVGWICGLVTVLVPLTMLGVRIVGCMLRVRSA